MHFDSVVSLKSLQSLAKPKQKLVMKEKNYI